MSLQSKIIIYLFLQQVFFLFNKIKQLFESDTMSTLFILNI